MNRMIFAGDNSIFSCEQQACRSATHLPTSDYDDAGNRSHWYRTIGTTTTIHTYTYNTLNQMETWSYTVSGYTFLHTFTYDANGNRVKDVETVNSNVNNTFVYRWNQDNQLIKYQHYSRSGQQDILQKTVEYRYCRTCGGQRTERIEYDGAPGSTILEWLRYEMEGLNHWRIDERFDSPTDGNSVIDDEDPFRIQRYYVNGPGQLGQIVKATVFDYSGEEPVSTDYYYGYDVLGNVSVISDGDGEEADQFEQDAFGNQVENSWSNPIAGITEHLTTKQFDADLGPNGLYYFNARWYDPMAGAFLSYDKLKHMLTCAATSRLYKLRDDYSYCYANPVLYIDPSGNTPIDPGVSAAEIADYLESIGACNFCWWDQCAAWKRFFEEAKNEEHIVDLVNVQTDKVTHFAAGGACSACIGIPFMGPAAGIGCQALQEYVFEPSDPFSPDTKGDWQAAINGASAAFFCQTIFWNGDWRAAHQVCKKCLQGYLELLIETNDPTRPRH